MRALILTTEVGGRGGVQYAGRLLLRALRDCLGADCRLTLVSVRDHAEDARLAGVNCTVFGGRGNRVRTALAALRQWWRQPWDLVLLGHANLAGLAGLAARVRPAPLLGVVYSLEAWQPITGLRRRGLRRADKLLYISQHAQGLSHRANPWLASLSHDVCHLGLLPADGREKSNRASGCGTDCQSLQGFSDGLPIRPTASLVAARSGGPFALSVGRMSRSEGYKGHEELIRRWPEVEQRRPGLRLIHIGDGDDRPRLEALARSTGANVQFLGSVDDATRDAYLAACRCFCLPARGEGFGLVYLEAMRAGKPVLAGSADAGREVVVDSVTGRTVDATNAPELLRGILDVSGERAEAMGQAGRERFLAQFSYERFLERFSRHVYEVMSRSGAVAR